MYSREQLIKYLESLIEQDEVVNALFSALKHKYYSVYMHCINVCYCTYLLAKKINLPENECLRAAFGALLHDVGKLNVSPKILYKPGKLTSKERQAIERHPVIGVNVLHGSKNLSDLRNAILYHHERYDGKGYCHGLKGKDIPLEARIVSVCDCFDAMISYRSYKKALTLEEAKDELVRNKNTQLDGKIVDHFLDMADDFYCRYYRSAYSAHFNGVAQNGPAGTNINWKVILDQLTGVGIILIDKHDIIRFCNRFAGEIRNVKQSEIIGTSFLDFHRQHRKKIIREKLLKVKRGEINGWERLMAIKGRYIENKYIKIIDENGNYDGLLMFTKDVTEREKLLRLLEINIEKLNILVQANNLLSEVHDLQGTFKNISKLVNKIVKVEHINIIIRTYKGVNFYNIGKMNGFTEQIQKYIAENIETILDSAPKKILLKKISDKLLISILLKFNNRNGGIIYIQTGGEAVIEEKETELLAAIGNYATSAIQNHL